MSAKMIKELVDNWKEEDGFLNDELFEEAFSKAENQVPAHRFNEQLQVDLKSDLDVLAHMSTTLEELEGQPDPKLKALAEIMREMPAKKVAIFTAYQDTANHLKEQITNRPELLNHRFWTDVIGSGSSAPSRARAIEQFYPDSANDKPGSQPPDDEVDVLLSTDVLSEGQNLQQAQAVLSFNMLWNSQRVVQRNGRVIRLRSPHDTAYLYTLLPVKGDLDNLLKLEPKLRAKIRAANAAVRTETPVLADIAAESQAYADLNTYSNRLADGDVTLLDEQDSQGRNSSAFAGELFRSQLRRVMEEDGTNHLKQLPWKIGAVFIQRSPTPTEIVANFGLQPIHIPQAPKPITKDDLGIVCYQVVMPQAL